MTRSAHRSPPPSPPPPRKYDAVLDDERSRVRVRVRPSPDPETPGWSSERPTLRASAELDREERLERKIRFANVVRRLLPPDDRRSALLGAALLHRDEQLIDQVLAALPSSERELGRALDQEPVVDLTEHAEVDTDTSFEARVPIIVEEPVEDDAPDTERESVGPMTLRPAELSRRRIGTLLPPAPVPGDDEPEEIG